ncbi:MAG: hypothetical protein ACFE0J_05015 [Elainellaceae cyanobacterium]
MKFEQFINKIKAACSHLNPADIDSYFANYTGNLDETSAEEHIELFSNRPEIVREQPNRDELTANDITAAGSLGFSKPVTPDDQRPS